MSPLGEIVAPDRAIAPREVISPAVARNGYVSFHIAVTAAPNTIYFLATQTYPANVVGIKLYKEGFVRAAGEWIPDTLEEQKNPQFVIGVMPDYHAPDPSRTTEVYLLDIWVPPGTPAGLVRVEALVKTAEWTVAPLELRIMHARVPSLPVRFVLEGLPGPGDPLDGIVWGPLWAALAEIEPSQAPAPVNVRSVVRRNALQDAALVSLLDPAQRRQVWLRAWTAMLERWPSGAESYLPVRNYILRNSR